MKSVTTSKFRACLEKLPDHIQVKARKSYRLWLANPLHPSLQFKQIHSISPMPWEFSKMTQWFGFG